MLMLLGQLQHDAMLGEVGVLILVHQNVAELLLIAGQDIGMVAEEQEGVEQQVVEVHGVRLPAPLPVAAVHLAQGGHVGGLVDLAGFAAGGIGGGCHQVVLGVGDA